MNTVKVQMVYSCIAFPNESFSTRLIEEGIAADTLSAFVLVAILARQVADKYPEDVNIIDVYIGGRFQGVLKDYLN